MSNSSDLLNVGIKKGTFYLSSNVQEGKDWTKQEFKNPNTGEPMVKYHKDISVKGDLVYLAMRDDKYKGMCLNMIVSGDDESYSLQIPIMNANGSVKATNEYFNSIAGVLEKVEFGDTITMFVNNKKEDKQGRLYRNLVVLDEDGSLIKSDFSFEDVPNWEAKEVKDDFGAVKKEWNPSKANQFFIGKIKAVTAKWEEERLARKAAKEPESTSAPEPKQKAQPKDAKPKNSVPTATPDEAFGGKRIADTEDDLPF